MNKKNKVIALWSPVSGVGVTFTAINIAKMMGERGAKVALFDFDLKTPDTHIYLENKDNVHCIDNVIPFTAGGRLPAEVIENNIQEVEGFSYLRGTNSPDQAQYVTVESLSSILDTAREMYDYIIIDTHSIIDNAGTFVAIREADKALLLTEKNAITIQAYTDLKNLLSESFDIERFKIVINKVQKNVYMDKSDVEEFYGMGEAHELPLLDAEFTNAINQGRWMSYLYSGDKVVRKYIKSLEELIIEEIKPDFAEKAAAKKSNFSLFRKRK